jgi:TATA-box binding protein (TBP) (component of TFIID and TFIIIB)
MRSSRHEFLSVRPCGRDLFELIPKKATRIDLASASKALTAAGYDVSELSEMALTASGPNEISIFPNGKMLIFPAKTNEEAEKMGQKMIEALMIEKGCISWE